MSGDEWHAEPRLSELLGAMLPLLALAAAAAVLVVVIGTVLARRLRALARRDVRPPARFYVGRLESPEPAVFIVDSGVRRLAHAGPAPRRFGWGSADAGAQHLAYSLLGDARGEPPDAAEVRGFRDSVVARLPADGFVLPVDEVQRWLAAQPGRSGWTQVEVHARGRSPGTNRS